jgi:signal transduction histidine kinase
MRVNTLRLRLAGGFALALVVGLTLLATLAIAYLRRESTRRLDRRLDAVASGIVQGIDREYRETPDSSLAFVAREVVAEWPGHSDAFLVMDAAGRSLEGLGATADRERVGRAAAIRRPAPRRTLAVGGPALRVRVLDTSISAGARAGTAQRLPLRIVSYGSTAGIDTDAERLRALFGVSMLSVVLFSLFAGYLVAGRALRPVRELAREMADMVPGDLTRRLETGDGIDEVSILAVEFNALLTRLELAQQRNSQFVREAAHQIRTPLTLVLGEAGYALAGDEGRAIEDPERVRATLLRICRAAEVMKRRVDELFLLAAARTGEPVRLEQLIELDGLILECADLMRARAADTGHGLEIGEAAAVTIRGHEALLQEAVLELLENACRHGDATVPVTLSCRSDGSGTATLEVASGGPPFVAPDIRESSDATGGMGLSIVRWVATSHQGTLVIDHVAGINRVQLRFPAVD